MEVSALAAKVAYLFDIENLCFREIANAISDDRRIFSRSFVEKLYRKHAGSLR